MYTNVDSREITNILYTPYSNQNIIRTLLTPSSCKIFTDTIKQIGIDKNYMYKQHALTDFPDDKVKDIRFFYKELSPFMVVNSYKLEMYVKIMFDWKEEYYSRARTSNCIAMVENNMRNIITEAENENLVLKFFMLIINNALNSLTDSPISCDNSSDEFIKNISGKIYDFIDIVSSPPKWYDFLFFAEYSNYNFILENCNNRHTYFYSSKRNHQKYTDTVCMKYKNNIIILK